MTVCSCGGILEHHRRLGGGRSYPAVNMGSSRSSDMGGHEQHVERGGPGAMAEISSNMYV